MSPATLTPHPWNSDFTWMARGGPFEVLADAQAEQFDRDGYVVMSGAFAPELVGRVTAEIDAAEAKTDEFLRSQHDGRFMIAEAGAITFSVHLVTRSALLRAFATNPVILGLCADLVGPDVNLYWDQAVYKKPEKPRRFPWHQDNGYTFVQPQQYLTCWVALTDATIDNGCPWVAPGLHRQGTLAHTYVEPLGFECFSQPDQAVAVPVASGGMVVFSSLTPHLTGPNTTVDVRKAYILQYAPAGAMTLKGDASSGPPVATASCDAPDRQFAVLRDGAPLPAPGLPAG